MEKLKKIMMIVFVVGILLVPVVSTAGSLEPSAAPAPTMKTLDQIPPTWSQKLPAAQRFELVLDGAAVLDKETGLVWEKAPVYVSTSWSLSIDMCLRDTSSGGRKGWHLPTIEQLASLVDTSVAGTLKLPAGHPFQTDCLSPAEGYPVECVAPTYYWSITADHQNPIMNAAAVNFSSGNVTPNITKSSSCYVWCVRGGQAYDGQLYSGY